MMSTEQFGRSGSNWWRHVVCALLCLAQLAGVGVRPVVGQVGTSGKRRVTVERSDGGKDEEEQPTKVSDDDPTVAAALDAIRAIYPRYQRHYETGRLEEALAVGRQMLAIAEAQLPEGHWGTGALLNNLGETLTRLDREEEAVPLLLRAVENFTSSYGEEDPEVANALENLGNAYMREEDWGAAADAYQQSLAIRLKRLGAEHQATAQVRRNMSLMYAKAGRFEEAYAAVDEAARVYEKLVGTDHAEYFKTLRARAGIWGDEGIAMVKSGRYAEARQHLVRATGLLEQVNGTKNSMESAELYNYLGVVDYREGRFREARAHYELALRLHERFKGPDDPSTAYVVKNLAYLMAHHNQDEQAHELFQRNYAICLKAFGPKHHRVADALLARSFSILGTEEAVADLKRALEIYHQLYGQTHVEIARAYNNLAATYVELGEWEKARASGAKALAQYRDLYDAEYPGISYPLSVMAHIARTEGEYVEARRYLDEAIALREGAGESPGLISTHYEARAFCWWEEGERERAIRELVTAIELAGQQRTRFAGGDEDRATAFTKFASTYEVMIEWQLAIGEAAAALVYAEQARARSLLDQIQLAGVDLLAGLDETERAALQQREAAAEAAVAKLEEKMAEASAEGEADGVRGEPVEVVREELPAARAELARAFAAVRNASPAYQDLTAGSGGLPADAGQLVDTLQREVAGADALVLQYVIGNNGSYVFVIPPVGGEVRAVALEVGKTAAKKLGIEAGPLTGFGVSNALYREEGVWLQMTDPEANSWEGLATLWDVLVPEKVQQELLAGRYRTLVVLPDRALAHLPFEALVVGDAGGEPDYLLDAGPPIVYAPSASVMLHLMRGERKSEVTDRRPVLTVGDPQYAEVDEVGTESTSRMAYREMAARLTPLPYSGVESRWVAEVFEKNGIEVGKLVGGRATEAMVRASVPGRKVLHLACHGVADEEFFNTFGALVLSPARGRNVTSEDDGFLSLTEIYELDLRGCELAILSACQTNNGPDQVGEGVWSLSRGFLVAGARRVVASNWLVDDEAAASLVSVMASAIAREDAAGGVVDYAAAVQKAKRWVRKKRKWKQPYYWAGMVQLGPGA